MSKNKLQTARELIQEKEFSAARAVLETIAYDETAENWLQRLPPEEKKPQGRRWLPIATLAVGMACGLITGLGIGASTPRQPSTAPLAAVATTAAVTNTAGPTPTITETTPPSATPEPSVTPEPSATPAPLIFDSATYGLIAVIGPVEIPEGVYRAEAVTGGFIIVHINPVEGECGAGTSFLTTGLFSLSKGEATTGAEAIFTSRGCSVLMEVSNTQEAWTLSFEKVN